jgi:ABC-type transporter Mla subunit MlaD
MSTTYSEAVESVEQLVEALTEARRALRATEVALRRALKKVDQGGTVANALVAAQPADSRQTVNDALTVVEQCRHEARRRVFAAALDEGMTIGALGRAWGFSRQMAARYAKEARSAA